MPLYKNISEDSFAIRPIRILADELRVYTALTAPEGKIALEWCRSILNRISIKGAGDIYEKDHCLIDLLNKDGDIVDDYVISERAFNYARVQLKFKQEI